MDYNFQADIGANISDFQQQLAEVDAIIQETAMGTDAMIGADLTEFQQNMQQSEQMLQELQNGAQAEIGADISEFMAEAATVETVAQALSTGEHDVEIGADIAGAMAGIAVVGAAAQALDSDSIWIRIRSSWRNYQATMGLLASFSRNFSEITGMVAGGLKVMISPAVVPVIASVVGLLGQLGPMLGAIGGSSFALVTAFGAAGIGAAGFASVAIPAITGVVDRAGEIADLDEKISLAKAAGEFEKANEHIKEMDNIFKNMSGSQLAAQSALTDFKNSYSDLVTEMEPAVLITFSTALDAIKNVLELARPLIDASVDAFTRLIGAFNANLEAKDVKDFFNFLNTQGASSLQVIGEAIGNFMQGIFNLMTAFGPLSVETQGGFLAMSEGFREWSASLGESKKFQQFVDYVSENMPKIRSIFSDAIQGIINVFAAFAPSSADMMTSLEDMMERFKEWSSTLSQNQGFQNFIDYIKTNGPVVVSTIGNIVKFIVNLGIALAPIGEKMLGLVTDFISWMNSMMKAHSWVGKVIAAAVVLGGALMAVTPILILLNALFGGVVIAMVKFVAKTIWATAVQVAKWTWMGIKATANAIKVAAAWTFATGKAMVVAVAKMVASAAVFVAKWLWMGLKAMLHAAKVAAAWTLSTGTAMVVALAKMAASAAVFIAKWALMGAKALLHAAKVAAAWLLSTGAAMVTALASMVATAAVFVAKWVWMGAQALLAAARMAAAWFIALGPIGWVIAAVAGLVALIIIYWDEIVAWTKKAWTATWNWIKDTWQNITSKTSEAASAMWNTIKEKFSAIVSSVKEKMASAKATVQQKWEEAKAQAIAKLTALVTAVVKFFTQVVTKVKEKLSEAVRNVSEKIGEMPGKVLSFVGKMVSAGGDLIQGLIDGAVGMASSAISSVTDIAGNMVDAALSFFKIKSPSRVFMEMGAYLSEGLAVGVGNKARSAVSSVESVARNMTNAFNPQLAMADMRANAQLNTSVSRKDMGVVRHAFAAEIGKFEKQEPDLYLVVDGKELGKVVAKPVQEENDRRSGMVKVGRGL